MAKKIKLPQMKLFLKKKQKKNQNFNVPINPFHSEKC